MLESIFRTRKEQLVQPTEEEKRIELAKKLPDQIAHLVLAEKELRTVLATPLDEVKQKSWETLEREIEMEVQQILSAKDRERRALLVRMIVSPKGWLSVSDARVFPSNMFGLELSTIESYGSEGGEAYIVKKVKILPREYLTDIEEILKEKKFSFIEFEGSSFRIIHSSVE